MSLTVESSKRPEGGYIVIPKGRLDTNTYLEFEKKIEPYLNGGTKVLVLDMAELEYLSSAGLREMVRAMKKAKRGTGDVRLASPSERVAEVLELAGLDSIFQIYPNQVEAVGSF